jgi:hypothetical protein
LIEYIAAQLADGLTQAVQVGCPVDIEFGGKWDGAILCDSREGGSLGVLLLRVLHEAGVENVMVAAQIFGHLGKQRRRLRKQTARRVELSTMGGANAVGAGANGRARLGKSAFACGMFQCKVLLRLLAYTVDLLCHVLPLFCIKCITG